MSPDRAREAGDGVTAVAEDYLKTIWSAQEWDDAPVTTSALAARLGLAPSTVSEQVKRLVDAGLVVPAPYRPVELTEAGRTRALRVVRRHRLLETYLVEHLGYGWDQVHEEAEVLEHVVSELFLERIDGLLGHPSRDPHGDPIPAADGAYSRPAAVLLTGCGEGVRVRVARISDDDPAVLRWLADSGVVLDAVLVLVRASSDDGDLLVLTESRTELLLPRAAAAALRVVLEAGA
ncbi:metal-dependent transcriptional regulator [Quadrisphaera granulorum]|uniref:metal-dependent transcriptional regulator n=1 Tax=Quadrisphaera granulorum TaxID=317664 RepID=UPI000D6ACBF5|nr:metal-dependent transcriptional regulator [Quadrisphaera granulorum]